MISADTSIQGISLRLKLFWCTSLFSAVTLGVYLVVFNWLTVKNYGAFGISVITISYAIPQTTMVLFGGLTSDSINKQTLYRVCQTLYVVIGIVLFLTAIDEVPSLWFLGLFSFANGLIEAFSSPNKTSLISNLVPESKITFTQQMFYFATALGCVLGSVLSAYFLAPQVLTIKNTYGALAFLLYALGNIPNIFLVPKLIYTDQKITPEKTFALKMKTSLLGLKDSLLYLRSTFDIRVLIWILALVLMLGMPFTYLLSIYAHEHSTMQHSSKLFSHLYAALGAGNILGALLGILVSKSAVKQATLFVYIICGLCASAIAALLMTEYWEIVLMILLAGLFTSICTNLLKGLIQSQSRVDMRGRIAGFTQLLAGLSTMSAGLAGFVIHHLSNYETSPYAAYETVQIVLLGLLAILTLLSLPSILKLHIRI